MKKLLFLLPLLLLGCDGKVGVSERAAQFKEVSVIETGVLVGKSYTMLVDNQTGIRILYLGDAMVLLPSKTNKVEATQ